MAEPPEPEQLPSEIDERVTRFIEDHTWPLASFCTDFGLNPAHIQDYFMLMEDDFIPDYVRLYDTVLDLTGLEKPEARSCAVARLFQVLNPSPATSEDQTDMLTCDDRRPGTKSPGPPLASSPKRNRTDDASTIVLDDTQGDDEHGGDGGGDDDDDGDGNDDDDGDSTTKDRDDEDRSLPADESDLKAIRKALHILLARSEDNLKLVDEKSIYRVYRQDSVKDPQKLKGCLPLHRQFLSNYYAAEKELVKPKYVKRGTPVVMDAVRKNSRLYPMSQASIPATTDKEPDLEVGFIAKDRTMPQRIESITSFKTRSQLEKAVSGTATLSSSTMSSCTKLVRAASAAANYGNYFTFAAKKISNDSHAALKVAKALLDRDTHPSRHVERAKEKISSLMDTIAQEYTLLKAAGMTNEDTLSALSMLDTNIVLTQRDKVLDKLSTPLDYARQPLRTDSLVSESFFPSAPEVIRESRGEIIHQNAAVMAEHLAKQVAFRSNRGGNKGSRGSGGAFRGKQNKGQNQFQGNQFGGNSSGFGRARGGFRGSRGGGRGRGRGRGAPNSNNDKK